MISFTCIGVLLMYIANIKLDQSVTLWFTMPMPSYITVLPLQVLVPTSTSRFSGIACIACCWKSNPNILGRVGYRLLSATERDIKAFFFYLRISANIIIVLFKQSPDGATCDRQFTRFYKKWCIGKSWLAKMVRIWSMSCESCGALLNRIDHAPIKFIF